MIICEIIGANPSLSKSKIMTCNENYLVQVLTHEHNVIVRSLKVCTLGFFLLFISIIVNSNLMVSNLSFSEHMHYLSRIHYLREGLMLLMGGLDTLLYTDIDEQVRKVFSVSALIFWFPNVF